MELSGLESADVVEQVGLTDRSFSTAWDDVGRFRLYGGRVLVVPGESLSRSSHSERR
jgi:hypothetical protein